MLGDLVRIKDVHEIIEDRKQEAKKSGDIIGFRNACELETMVSLFHRPEFINASCLTCKHFYSTYCTWGYFQTIDCADRICQHYEPENGTLKNKVFKCELSNDLKDNITSSIKRLTENFEHRHNVHLYSEVANTEYGDSGLNIYMFDDDYYETWMCVGCFISVKTFEFIWNAGNDGMQSVFLLEKYIKVVFDELYYHLYHDEWDASKKDLPYIYVIMYSFFAYYDYTSYPKQIKYEIQKVNNIGIKK